MIRRVVFSALSVSLLLGCARSDRPTIRQVSLTSSDESSAITSANPPDTADSACPGCAASHRTHPKRSTTNHAKFASAASSKPGDVCPAQFGKKDLAHSVLGIMPIVAPGLTEIASLRDLVLPKGADESRKLSPQPHVESDDTKSEKIADADPPNVAEANPPKIAAAKPARTAPAPRRTVASQDTAHADMGEVRIGNVRLLAPKNWTREKPPLDLILVQFSLPRAPGDVSDAQLTVTAAGERTPRSVGRLQDLLRRETESGAVEHMQIGGNEVVLVESAGDDSDTSDESPSPVSEGRYRVLNATVFAGGKVYVINCTGPEKTVSERAAEFRAFLQTMAAVDKS
jgi:hypothetical protein